MVATNKEAKKAGALLDNDADTFLKNECKADKWVIVELSQVTKMDTLLISQVSISPAEGPRDSESMTAVATWNL